MLVTKPYARENAVRYAETWAFSQNPLFGDFRALGGNCTNFISQCVYAGSCIMNPTPVFGWYYRSLEDRTPSWTGVPYFYDFLVGNEGLGPFAEEVSGDALEIGDVIQLGREVGGYYHTLLVSDFSEDDILVAAQTDDAFSRPLSTYEYDFARYLHILGVRLPMPSATRCFENVLAGTSFAG